MKVIQNYTLTLNFVKKKKQTYSKHTNLQSQENYDDNFFSKKNLHILKDGTSGVQLGVIEQVTI